MKRAELNILCNGEYGGNDDGDCDDGGGCDIHSAKASSALEPREVQWIAVKLVRERGRAQYFLQ